MRGISFQFIEIYRNTLGHWSFSLFTLQNFDMFCFFTAPALVAVKFFNILIGIDKRRRKVVVGRHNSGLFK